MDQLNIDSWLKRLTDYVEINNIRPIPDSAFFIVFKQKRVKGLQRLEKCLDKKADHIAKKFGVCKDECLREFNTKYSFEKCSLPYIHLQSSTHKQEFRLFISKQVVDQPVCGFFNTYGLSLKNNSPSEVEQYSTVPDF